MTDSREELSRRIETLRAQIEANDKQWIEARDIEIEFERGKPKLQAELDRLGREYYKNLSPEEAWRYWIKRANRESLRIYWGAYGAELVDWDTLDPEEKRGYSEEEGWIRAKVTEIADRETILEVIELCDKAEEFEEEPGDLPAEAMAGRITELEAKLRNWDKQAPKARIDIERERSRLETELDSLTIQFLEAGDSEELWRYWIKRAPEFSGGINYRESGGSIEVVINHESDYPPPGFTRGSLEELPSDQVIRAVSEYAKSSDWFRYE